MSHIPKPPTQREMLEQLWTAVIGSNGEGVASISRQNRRDIQEIKEKLPTLQTRDDAAISMVAHEGRETDHKRRRSDVFMWLVMALITLGVGVPTWIQLIGG